MPYPGITAQIFQAHDGFYISGLTSSSSPYFDGEQGYSIPFILLHPQTPGGTVVLIPDTGEFVSYGFSSAYDEFTMNSIVDNNDSVFVAWSKMNHLQSDVPPAYYGIPAASVGKVMNKTVEKIFSLAGGLNPAIAVDETHTLHVLWQKVTPLLSRSDLSFQAYRSTILYLTRDRAGRCSDTLVIGNGFFPTVHLDQNGLHCTYFQADSSNQAVSHLVYQTIHSGVVGPPVTLYDIRSGQIFADNTPLSNVPLGRFAWDTDSLGGVHAGWSSSTSPSKVYVLHYSSLKGIQIDSTVSYYATITNFRFMPDGEVRIFASTEDTYISPAILRYEISKQGASLREMEDIPLPSNSSTLGEVIVDTSGGQHVLLNDFSTTTKMYLVKNVGTADTSVNYLASSYTFSASSYVDRNNRVWLAGERGATPIILNFLFSDVGGAKDFDFPLVIGNVWYYAVTNTEAPEPLSAFNGYDSVTATRDTTFSNGMIYVQLYSKRFGTEFLRKDGFRVFQYLPADSTEYLRFDFSAHKGDTIAVYPTAMYSRPMVPGECRGETLFGLEKKNSGIPGHSSWQPGFETDVADSIGITSETDGSVGRKDAYRCENQRSGIWRDFGREHQNPQFLRLRSVYRRLS